MSKIDKNSVRFNKRRSEVFHHIVGKLLCVCKRAILDIDPTIDFLYTRLAKSTGEDWLKLKRSLCYLKGTISIPRIIGVDSLSIIQSWVDV